MVVDSFPLSRKGDCAAVYEIPASAGDK